MTELFMWLVIIVLTVAVAWLVGRVLELKNAAAAQETNNDCTRETFMRLNTAKLECDHLVQALVAGGIVSSSEQFGMKFFSPGDLRTRIQGLELEVGRLQGLLIEAGVVAHTPAGICVDHSPKETDAVLEALLKKLGLQVKFHQTEEHFEVVKASKKGGA